MGTGQPTKNPCKGTRKGPCSPLPKRLEYCRSWLFIPGHEADALNAALSSRADAIVVDLEEFTPASARAVACQFFPTFAEKCRRRGIAPTIRINPFDLGGEAELESVIGGQPHAVFLPQVESITPLLALAVVLDDSETRHELSQGRIAIIPTLESRRGVVEAPELLLAPRVMAALIGTGDLTRDLGLVPAKAQYMLRSYRRRFLAACQRAGVLAIDGPWPLESGLADDQAWAINQGFRARCVIDPNQIPHLHGPVPR